MKKKARTADTLLILPGLLVPVESLKKSCFLSKNGHGRDRTADTRIFIPVLYQLSYMPFVSE